MHLLRAKSLCVCDILPQIDWEASNASQHLTVLKKLKVL
ncbi:MAG: ArsR family transcriptional regulator [Desulfitobacteriaceae bacterium]